MRLRARSLRARGLRAHRFAVLNGVEYTRLMSELLLRSAYQGIYNSIIDDYILRLPSIPSSLHANFENTHS